MTSQESSTSLSVRGEAQRTTAPDQARMFASLSATADSKSAAMSEVQAMLPGVLADLLHLGGAVLTAESTRAALTWSIQSMRTQEEYANDKITGIHGPTGRHQSSLSLVITIRDFSLLDGVSTALTSRDRIEVHNVSWSVDDDNADWAVVRADAIHAALLKGQDYAAALGGSIIRVDHVADAGLLGSSDGTSNHWVAQNSAFGGSMGGNDTSLDPVPQVLGATIEARFTAVVSALPGR